ncbi:hypothetical protein OG874_17360 [Nocardia sp. NBC_00565]|uniref:hypothetical protein n=1 Tax=Nocardia sp. NBC_00565 TaxID=2975993 RepID=UPI002E80F4CC|nr:hypothetical protein [Nocardia sp. NBC_00565]WUC06774.1 hypothetical protein OG874_17360 [Nocardia sp. NBC_00565]
MQLSAGTVVLILAFVVSMSVICGLAAAVVSMARGRTTGEAMTGAFRTTCVVLTLLLAFVTVAVLLLVTDFSYRDTVSTNHRSMTEEYNVNVNLEPLRDC